MNYDKCYEKEIARIFLTFDKQKQGQFIADLTYELTIYARDTYETGSLGLVDPVRMRGINEIMHRLTYRLLGLIQGAADTWEEEQFWQSLYEFAEQSCCVDDLNAAIKAATKSIGSQ